MMFSNLDIPIAAGVIAFIYAVILTEPDMFLAPWYRLLKKQIFKCRCVWPLWWHPSCTIQESGHPYNPMHKNIATMIFKLAIDCDRCIAGQLALWWYLARVDYTGMEYNFMEHWFLICIAIFVPIMMHKLYRECRK